MLKRYEELNEAQKEAARECRPNDYAEWVYRTAGVYIEFAAHDGRVPDAEGEDGKG